MDKNRLPAIVADSNVQGLRSLLVFLREKEHIDPKWVITSVEKPYDQDYIEEGTVIPITCIPSAIEVINSIVSYGVHPNCIYFYGIDEDDCLIVARAISVDCFIIEHSGYPFTIRKLRN